VPALSREGTLTLRLAIRVALPLIVAGATGSAAQPEHPLRLALPLDCKFGETCFIQQYFDHDPSSGMKDYRCGTMTYDGHDGVDLRIPTMDAQQRGVSVLAAAAGVIKAVRDGIADVNVRAIGFASVKGRECGNGVLIEHEGGWETMYCHMAKGSVHVREGERVDVGTSLGLVGLSGQTEFPHLHFAVGHNGKMVDPFAAGAAEACSASHQLWSEAAASALAYRSPAVINFGFADKALTLDDIEMGRAAAIPPAADSPVLVAFVRAIGLKAADIQSFTLKGPNGEVLAHSEAPPLQKNMAERFMYVGKRKAVALWPRGTYEAQFQIRRNGATALSRQFSFELR
jgi:murein DD-endopeptidase MepM/ murein hydrolase activator NlpD